MPATASIPANSSTPATSIEVTIERILPGGVGLAHAEGRTLFVALAAPGDVVRVRIDQIRGQIGFATIEEIIKPSPVRVEPPCPYFGRCGGCDFQQLNYEAQLEAKVEIIRDCLRRIARIEKAPEISITPSPSQWHYRGRANWQYNSRTKALGYFERGSHKVCDVAECAVLTPKLQDTFASLRKQMDALPEELRVIDVTAGDEGAALAPPLVGIANRDISRKIGDETYYFNAEAFFQTNCELLPPLVAEAIKDERGNSALDLYCGVGLFTLPLARRFGRVVGVEANASAASFARRNLGSAKLTNAEVITARVHEWLRDRVQSVGPLDLLLLDPPRTGLENRVVADILAIKPRRISYVSCDPATLARDLKKLIAGSFRLDSIAAFDMFPQTHHVETVVHMTRLT